MEGNGRAGLLAALVCAMMVLGGLSPVAVTSADGPSDDRGPMAGTDELMRLVWTATGESNSDYLCNDAGSAGDVNGDGFDDLLLSTGFVDEGGSKAGKSYLYYGSAQGLGDEPGWTRLGSHINQEMGVWNGGAGDVDADGFDDIVIGGERDDTVWFFYGSDAGPGSDPDRVMTGENANDKYGRVSCAGDINGDGYSDIIIGAYAYPSGANRGKAYAYHGSATGLGSTPNWTYQGTVDGGGFATDVKSAGDVNRDGYSDVLITASAAFSGRGGAYIFLGSPSGLSVAPSWTFNATSDGDTEEWCMGPGDVNGDGYDDIVLGCHNNDEVGHDAGKCYLFYGSENGPGDVWNWSLNGAGSEDELGMKMKPTGDVDNDGYADVLLGANQWWQGGPGYCYLFLGSPTGLAAVPDWKGVGEHDGDKYGYPVGGAGDVDGDGYDEVFSTASMNDESAYDAGKVYVYAYNVTVPPPPAYLSIRTKEVYSPAEAVVVDAEYTGTSGTEVLFEVLSPGGPNLLTRRVALDAGTVRTAQLRFVLSPSAIPTEYTVEAEVVGTGVSNSTAFVVMDVNVLDIGANATYTQGDTVDATVRYNGRPRDVTVTLTGPGSEVLVDRVETLQGGPLVADAGTVGLWHLDRCLGNAAPDASSNLHHGTMRGGEFMAGVFRSSARLDGVDDHIDLGSSAGYCPTSLLSLEAWVRFDSDPFGLAGERRYVIDLPGSYGLWYSAQGEGASDPDQLYFDLWDWQGVPTQGIAWQMDTWYLISATYDGSVARIYVDGALNNERALAKTLHASSANLTISTGRAGEAFPGRVDDVRLSSVARTPVEIAAAYDGSRSILPLGLASDATPGTYTIAAKVLGLDVQGSTYFDVVAAPVPAVLGVLAGSSYPLGGEAGVVITYNRPPAIVHLDVHGPGDVLVHAATLAVDAGALVHSFRLPRYLLPGTYNASAVVEGSMQLASDTFEVLGLEPTSPSGLCATASKDSVALRWLPPEWDGGVPLLGYRLLRGTTPDNQSVLAEVPAGTLAFNDTAIVHGTTYHYRVVARNTVGDSSASGPASATTVGFPTPPRGLRAVATGTISLTWDGPASDGGMPVVGYRVHRGTEPGSTTFLAAVGGDVLSFEDGMVLKTHTYYYIVTASTALYESGPSDVASAMVVGVPDPPRDLTVSADATFVGLSWSPPASDGGMPITGYAVFRGTEPGSFARMADVGPDVLSYEDIIDLDHTYYYCIKAVNERGESGMSGSAAVLPPRAQEEPFPWLVVALVIALVILLFTVLAVTIVARSRRRREGEPSQIDLVPVMGPARETTEDVVLLDREVPPPKVG